MFTNHSNWKISYETKTNRQKITFTKPNNSGVVTAGDEPYCVFLFHGAERRGKNVLIHTLKRRSGTLSAAHYHKQNKTQHQQDKHLPSSCFMAFLRTYFYFAFDKSVSFFLWNQRDWMTTNRYETTCQPATVISLSLHGHVFASLYSLIVSVSLHMFKHFSKWIIQCQAALV